MFARMHDTANAEFRHAVASMVVAGLNTSDALFSAGAAGRAGVILGPAE